MVNCVYCEKRMKANLLLTHIQTVHMDKKWYCEDCRCSLPSAYSLRRHRQIHHKNNNEAIKPTGKSTQKVANDINSNRND